MAVEARHINPFPSQLMINGNLMMMNTNQQEANTQLLSPQIRFTGNMNHHHHHHQQPTLPQQNHQFLLSTTQQPYNHPMTMCESSLQAKTESGLTCNNLSRKRLRDTINNTQIYTADHSQKIPSAQYSSSSLLDEDFLPQMLHQHQYDVETLIAQHTKRIRLELAEKQMQQARSLASALSEAVAKKLKEREDQITRMGKINMALQERVKSLYVENQLWRDLAQTNEATANSLRTNLEQVMLHVSGEEKKPTRVAEVEDDVESCCGSNDEDAAAGVVGRTCRMCGERESCVLLLPCRHLCLCAVCGSGGSQTVTACPVCNCGMNATLHVNMSSSS